MTGALHHACLTDVILSSNKIRNGDNLALAYQDCCGKWLVTEYCYLLSSEASDCSTDVLNVWCIENLMLNSSPVRRGRGRSANRPDGDCKESAGGEVFSSEIAKTLRDRAALRGNYWKWNYWFASAGNIHCTNTH